MFFSINGVLMCRKLRIRFEPANTFFSTFSFSLVYYLWLYVNGFKPAFFYFFSFLCMLKLVHVNYIWVHINFSLFTNSFLYCHPTWFFLGKPLYSLCLNSGSGSLSCSIMVFPGAMASSKELSVGMR